MRPSRQFATIILAVLLASLLGCAGTFKHEATGEYFDDSVLNTTR